MYRLIASPQASRELKKLKKVYREAIILAFQEIRDDPFVGKPLTREMIGRFSYRVGVFRIIYKVSEEDNRVEIISAGHRSTVYN